MEIKELEVKVERLIAKGKLLLLIKQEARYLQKII